MRTTHRPLIAALVAVAAVAAACGGDDDASPTTTAAASATTAVAATTEPAEGPDATTAPDASTPATTAAAGVACEKLDEPVTLRLGHRGGSAGLHIFTADGLGYFADENITLEIEPIASPSDALPLLQTGEIDVAGGGLTVGIINAIGRGLDVRMVAAQGQYPYDAPAPAGIYVRTDLLEDGTVKEIADLKGLTMGLAGGSNDIGNAGAYLISLFLAEGGLTLKDVNVVNVATAENPIAFQQEAIDFTFLPGNVVPIVEADDLARPFGDPNVLAHKAQGGILFGPNLLEDNREIGIAFMRAVFRGAERIQGDYRGDEEVIEALLASGLYERETLVNQPYYYFPADLAISEETMNEFQQVFLDYGGLIESGEKLPYESLVDDELRQEALASYQSCYP